MIAASLHARTKSEARMHSDVRPAHAALPEGLVGCLTAVSSAATPPYAPGDASERAAPGVAHAGRKRAWTGDTVMLIDSFCIDARV